MQVDASPYAAINRARDLQGERTALDASQPMRLVGRALMVRVRAHNDAGAELQTSTIIELTGLSARPYIVREKLPDFG
jgi:hypothetical protein